MSYPTIRAAASGAAIALIAIMSRPGIAHPQSITVGDPIQSGYVNLTRTAGSSGNPWIEAAGQTFRTPNAVSVALASWSFWLNDYASMAGLPPVPVRLEIVEWSGAAPVGAPVFTSAPVTPTNGSSEEATFNVGINLDPAKTYVAMAVPTGGGPDIGLDGFLFDATGQFASGNFVYFETSFDQNTKMYRDLLDHPAIDTNEGDFFPVYATYDATFQATFVPKVPVTSTPEPATLALVGLGLAGLAAIARRSKA